MATSGSQDWTLTRDEIIKGAIRKLGELASGETPSFEEMDEASQALNGLVKGWQMEGIGIWKNVDITLFLALNQATYSLGPSGDNCTESFVKTEIATAASTGDGTIDVDSIEDVSSADYIGIELDGGDTQWTTVNGAPSGSTITLTDVLTDDVAVDNHVYAYTTKTSRPIDIIDCRRHTSDDNETTVEVGGRLDYDALSNKTSSGLINSIYFDKQLTNARLFVWPIANETKTYVKMLAKLPFDDFDSASNNADFPQECLRALIWNLALELAPEYKQQPPPLVIAKAQETKMALEGYDTENASLIMEIENR